MIYAYIRVSTNKQKMNRQRENIAFYCGQNGIEFDLVKIYEDKYSGRTLNRPSWEKLMEKVKENDTIIFDEVSRMSRDGEEGFKAYQELFNKKVNLIFIKEPHINTDVYKKGLEKAITFTTGTAVDCILNGINEMMVELAKEQVLLAFKTAQKERDFLSQRTKEGIRESRKKSGHKVGDTYETKKAKESKEKILELSAAFKGNLTDAKVMKYIGISKPTYYKYKRELLEGQE